MAFLSVIHSRDNEEPSGSTLPRMGVQTPFMFVSVDRKKKRKCVKVDNYVRQSSRHVRRPWGRNAQKQASAGRAPARQSWNLNAYRARKKHVGCGDAVSDCQRLRSRVFACGDIQNQRAFLVKTFDSGKKDEMKERSLESGGRCIKLPRRDFRNGAGLRLSERRSRLNRCAHS